MALLTFWVYWLLLCFEQYVFLMQLFHFNFYLQWKTKFFPSLLVTCWWYDWLFKIVVMRQTRVALRFIDVKACFLCKYSSISLSSLSLQASSRFSSPDVFLMLSQVENIEYCSNLPFTRLNTFDLTARK